MKKDKLKMKGWMNMTTLEKVKAIILKLKKKNITEADLKPEALLVENLKLDSLDYTELLVMAEETFAITIPQEDVKEMTTIAYAVAYLDKRIAK